MKKNIEDWERMSHLDVFLRASKDFSLTLKLSDASGEVRIENGHRVTSVRRPPSTTPDAVCAALRTRIADLSVVELALSPTPLHLPVTAVSAECQSLELKMALSRSEELAAEFLPDSVSCPVHLMDGAHVVDIQTPLGLRGHVRQGDRIRCHLYEPSARSIAVAAFWLDVVAHFEGEEQEQMRARVHAEWQSRKRPRTERDAPGSGTGRSSQEALGDTQTGSNAQSVSGSMLHGEMHVLSLLQRMEIIHKGNMAQPQTKSRGRPWEEWTLEGGWTIAHLAAARGYRRVLARLLELGMSPLVCGDDGSTGAVLALAELKGHTQCVAVLKEACVGLTAGGRSTPRSTTSDDSSVPAGSSRVEDSWSEASSCSTESSSCGEAEQREEPQVEGPQQLVFSSQTPAPGAEQPPRPPDLVERQRRDRWYVCLRFLVCVHHLLVSRLSCASARVPGPWGHICSAMSKWAMPLTATSVHESVQ